MPALPPTRRREGFLSGSFASQPAPAVPAPTEQARAPEVNLATEVLARRGLEARSVLVYGLNECEATLRLTAQVLQTLEAQCGSIAGAFRFPATAPLGYERGYYMSAVFLVVFDARESVEAACALSTDSTGTIRLCIRRASTKRRPDAAAERVLESFLPVAHRQQLRDQKTGAPRQFLDDELSVTTRLWVVILYVGSTYYVDWPAARAAARRHCTVVIDESRVILPFTDPSTIQARPTLEEELGTLLRQYGDGGIAPQQQQQRAGSEAAAVGHQRPTALQLGGGGGARGSGDDDALGRPPLGGAGDGYRTAQQRYYDERYGRPDYSWDGREDYYYLRSDAWRLTRYGAGWLRWAARGVRDAVNGLGASEQPLRVGSSGDGGGASRSAEPSATEARGEGRGRDSDRHHRHHHREEEERIGHGGLRRRYGGVELRRPHPVEGALMWAPGVEYIRPVMNFFGFWLADEGRGDGAGYDPEDRRLAAEDANVRMKRVRREGPNPAGDGRPTFHADAPLPIDGGRDQQTSPAAPFFAAAHSSAGAALYPRLAPPPAPGALNDLSRLTVDNIDVRLPARAAPATGSGGGADMASRKRHREVSHHNSFVGVVRGDAAEGGFFRSGGGDGGAARAPGQGRGGDGEQSRQQPPLRSALKRSAAERTALADHSVASSDASMPHKRPNIRVLRVQPPPNRDADTSFAPSSIHGASAGQSLFTDDSVVSNRNTDGAGARRAVNFSLPS